MNIPGIVWNGNVSTTIYRMHVTRQIVRQRQFASDAVRNAMLLQAAQAYLELLRAEGKVIGFATLGLFPVYYSFSQELTLKHQGKLSGALGCINWLAMYLLHETVGTAVKQTGSNSLGVALAGLAPMLGVAALLLLWGKDAPKDKPLPAQ